MVSLMVGQPRLRCIIYSDEVASVGHTSLPCILYTTRNYLTKVDLLTAMFPRYMRDTCRVRLGSEL